MLEGLAGWEPILSYLHQVARTRIKGLAVILDEFPYLCESNSAIPSILQKVWDAVTRSGAHLKLVLCGSRISFMEGILAERNPLHGRQTCEIFLEPMSYREASLFFPSWPAEDKIRAYGVFGGIPHYLSLCGPSDTLEENIIRLILSDGAPLQEEPNHILQAELQNVSRYGSILKAVADGLTERGDILNRVLDRDERGSSITPYIDKLIALRLLKKTHSLEIKAPEKGRNARYYLADSFLSFHFRFVLPNLSAIQAGHGREVLRARILPHFDGYMGPWFEEVCREYVRLFGEEKLPAVAGKVGKIWAPDFDLDVAGEFLTGERFAGECKWSRNPVGSSVLRDLRRGAARCAYFAAGAACHHVLFSRSGFTPELRKIARADEKTRLIAPSDLLGHRRTTRS